MRTVLPALLLLLSIPALAAEPVTAPTLPADDPDTREVIVMDPAGRDLVLTEMRLFLEGVQKITAGLAAEDIETAAFAARRLGLGMVETLPEAVMQQLPPSFRQLGGSTHADFDQIALDLETVGDPQHALRQLSETLNKCVACHATWRIEATPSLRAKGLAP